ncbi:MAG: 16S rRNA (cytidine(1402)-2'-O)-methyltransferase [Oligoflexia bacterium]|nr:16S rRNA (cytidine(1402)-2'-O)-methyltransferase [Oligoflexia bacterium]
MGNLYLLSTPIGNLSDLSLRGRQILMEEKNFVVEDTRVFKKLLGCLNIPLGEKNIFSFHDHSNENVISRVLQLLSQGENLCLVSDAGSPIISDPAYPIIRSVLTAGFAISSIPGASSPIVALELSGLPPYPFHFNGFFPRGERAQLALFQRMMMSGGGTHILFESPLRVEESVQRLCEFFSDSDLAVVRELTKKFEKVYRFSAKEWEQIKKEITYKGEFVVLIHLQHGAQHGAAFDCERWNQWNEIEKMAEELLQYYSGHVSIKLLSKLLAMILRKNKKEVYDFLISRK